MPKRPPFPPAHVHAAAAFPVELGDEVSTANGWVLLRSWACNALGAHAQLGGTLLACWSFLVSFSEVLALPRCTVRRAPAPVHCGRRTVPSPKPACCCLLLQLDDLLAAVAQGTASELLGAIHIGVLRLLQADTGTRWCMHRCVALVQLCAGRAVATRSDSCPSRPQTSRTHCRGGACNRYARATQRFTFPGAWAGAGGGVGLVRCMPCWAWTHGRKHTPPRTYHCRGFDVDVWRAHLNLMTWPEVARQVAIAAGLGRCATMLLGGSLPRAVCTCQRWVSQASLQAKERGAAQDGARGRGCGVGLCRWGVRTQSAAPAADAARCTPHLLHGMQAA